MRYVCWVKNAVGIERGSPCGRCMGVKLRDLIRGMRCEVQERYEHEWKVRELD